jgi:hypothetical protein
VGGGYRLARGWILEGRVPQWHQQIPVPGQSTEDYLRAGLTELLAEFRRHDADTPAATWWSADPTYGFWYRRTAHETTIHRIDLQLAAVDAGAARPDAFRRPGPRGADPAERSDANGDSTLPAGDPRASSRDADPITPVAEDYAIDGVDEALAVWFGQRLAMLGLSGTATKSVGVHTGGHHWIARAGPGFTEAWPCSAREAQRADAQVSGSPMQVYLWMWGRRDHRTVTWTGDVDAAGQLWALMRLATR